MSDKFENNQGISTCNNIDINSSDFSNPIVYNSTADLNIPSNITTGSPIATATTGPIDFSVPININVTCGCCNGNAENDYGQNSLYNSLNKIYNYNVSHNTSPIKLSIQGVQADFDSRTELGSGVLTQVTTDYIKIPCSNPVVENNWISIGSIYVVYTDSLPVPYNTDCTISPTILCSDVTYSGLNLILEEYRKNNKVLNIRISNPDMSILSGKVIAVSDKVVWVSLNEYKLCYKYAIIPLCKIASFYE